MKKLICLLLLCAGCSTSKETLKVAATAVPHAQLLEYAKPLLKEKGIELKILVMDDYNLPNRALADGEVDANFFQHLPFLEEQIKQFDYPIISYAAIEIEPMGIYSKKIIDLSQLKERALIALPNDPTNEARALRLLDQAGVIKLDNINNFQATILNIIDNPKHLRFQEIDASMLTRTLPDVEVAAIPTNFALLANLNPLTDALVMESTESPYANILAIRRDEESRTDLQHLKEVVTSEEMRAFILSQYHGAILPAF